jgi:hypothetical protein
MLEPYIYIMLGLAHPKQQAKNLLNRRWGLYPCCPLPLAALGGESRGAAALLFSMESRKSFLILKGWCFLSHPKVRFQHPLNHMQSLGYITITLEKALQDFLDLLPNKVKYA